VALLRGGDHPGRARERAIEALRPSVPADSDARPHEIVAIEGQQHVDFGADVERGLDQDQIGAARRGRIDDGRRS
jgi:hypothetical protein